MALLEQAKINVRTAAVIVGTLVSAIGVAAAYVRSEVSAIRAEKNADILRLAQEFGEIRKELTSSGKTLWVELKEIRSDISRIDARQEIMYDVIAGKKQQ